MNLRLFFVARRKLIRYFAVYLLLGDWTYRLKRMFWPSWLTDLAYFGYSAVFAVKIFGYLNRFIWSLLISKFDFSFASTLRMAAFMSAFWNHRFRCIDGRCEMMIRSLERRKTRTEWKCRGFGSIRHYKLRGRPLNTYSFIF